MIVLWQEGKSKRGLSQGIIIQNKHCVDVVKINAIHTESIKCMSVYVLSWKIQWWEQRKEMTQNQVLSCSKYYLEKKKIILVKNTSFL